MRNVLKHIVVHIVCILVRYLLSSVRGNAGRKNIGRATAVARAVATFT